MARLGALRRGVRALRGGLGVVLLCGGVPPLRRLLCVRRGRRAGAGGRSIAARVSREGFWGVPRHRGAGGAALSAVGGAALAGAGRAFCPRGRRGARRPGGGAPLRARPGEGSPGGRAAARVEPKGPSPLTRGECEEEWLSPAKRSCSRSQAASLPIKQPSSLGS